MSQQGHPGRLLLGLWLLGAQTPSTVRPSRRQQHKLDEMRRAGLKEAEERSLRIKQEVREYRETREREKQARDDELRRSNWALIENATWRPQTHEDKALVLSIARSAIEAGVDRTAVLTSLRKFGLDPSTL